MKIVFLTGAGISAPAGIPTFVALYNEIYNDETTSDEEKQNLLNQKAIEFGEKLKANPNQYTPTEMHWDIAHLWRSITEYDLKVFTTNIDTLHETTGVLPIRIHGTVDDPVLFGMEPRFVDEFEAACNEADRLIVVGHRLGYSYLTYPISVFSAFKHPPLLLDTDPYHEYSEFFRHETDQNNFFSALQDYIESPGEPKCHNLILATS